MALLDLLGRRWALRILWEVRHGPLAFRALRERCDGMSPSVLMRRLRELRDAGIIELGTDGYAAVNGLNEYTTVTPAGGAASLGRFSPSTSAKSFRRYWAQEACAC